MLPTPTPPGLYDWLTHRTPPTATVRAGDELVCEHCTRLIEGGEVATFRRRDYAAFCPTCAPLARS